MAVVRRRRPETPVPSSPDASFKDHERHNATARHGRVLLTCIAMAVVMYVAVVEGVYARVGAFGRVVPQDEAAFSAANALRHIRHMGKWKREVNSPELDEALSYVEAQLAALTPVAKSNHLVMEVESFTATGNFACTLAQTSQIGVSYGGARSVVARLRPSSQQFEESDALLLNAHVDSAWDAPGVSDNVIGVGILLELARVLSASNGSASDPALRRPVVLLFNGAEEPLLAGAHGFMAQHRWAKSLAAHINLESMGSGAAYVLFQLGPQNGWLAEAYARAVRLPSASGAASDLFASGLIPAETDFRIFKAFGVPGYDFALIDNGYVYHTAHDDLQEMDESAVYTGGSGVFLPLTLELAGRPDAIGKQLQAGARPAAERPFVMDEKRVFDSNSATFFDFLSLFAITYAPNTRSALNLGALGLFTALFSWPRSSSTTSPLALRLRMFLCFLTSTLVGLALSIATAGALMITDRRLAWFGSVYSALAVYMPPFLYGAAWTLQETLPNVLDPLVAMDAMLNGVGLLFALLLAVMHGAELKATYIPLLLLAPVLLVMATFGYRLRSRSHLVFGVIQLGTFLTLASYSHSSMRTFLGLLGRAGKAPSDVVCAVLIGMNLCFILLPAVSIVAAGRRSGLRTVRSASRLTLVAVACVVALRPLRRSEVYSRRAPKRLIVAHHHSPQQDPPSTVGIIPMDSIDPNLPRILGRLGDLTDLRALKDVTSHGAANAGITEFIFPYRKFLSKCHTYAVGQAPPLDVPIAKVLDTTEQGEYVNVTIRVQARNTMQLSVRLNADNAAASWSLAASLRNGSSWVRHVGNGAAAEELVFSVLARRAEDGKRRKLALFVSSVRRPGANGVRSSVLDALHFEEWEAPVFGLTTTATFEL